MEPASSEIWASLKERVRQNGDEVAARLGKRLDGLGRSAELRRFDVYATERPGIIARECRTADVFVGLRSTPRRRSPAHPADLVGRENMADREIFREYRDDAAT